MEQNRKYVLVTGASSGIGRKIATGLSETYNVVLNGRNIEKLKASKEKCSSSGEQIRMMI